MRNILSLIHLGAIVSLLLISSCSKKTPVPVNTNLKSQTIEGYLIATVDNGYYSTPTYIKVIPSATYEYGRLKIRGAGSNSTVELNIESLNVGDYYLSSTSNSYANYIVGSSLYTTISQGYATGTISITEVDKVNKTLTGTFNYTCYLGTSSSSGNSYTVESGSFTKVSYVDNNNASKGLWRSKWDASNSYSTIGSASVILQYGGIDFKGYVSGTYPLSIHLIDQNTGSHSLAYNSGYAYNTIDYNGYTNTSYSDFGQVQITEIDKTNKTISGFIYSYDYSYSRILISEFYKLPYTSGVSAFVPTFAAKVNGSDYIMSGVSASLYSSYSIDITATSTSGKNMYLQIPANPTLNTNYSINYNSYCEAYYNNNYTYNSYNSGTIKITAHNKTNRIITGTFNFNGYINYSQYDQITQGSFSVQY